MIKRRFAIPSTGTLVAFECAARHCNFSRTAEELNTSQSAISRHIADLEARLGVRLFDRQGKKLRLTEQGEHFHRAVVSGLENIQSAAIAIADWPVGDQLTIACTHEISHLFVMPRFEALQAAVGDDVRIRVMTYEYDALETSLDPRIDLTFTYEASDLGAGQSAVVFREAVRPVCAPSFAKANATVFKKPVSAWGELEFLQLGKQNKGWATWEDWFEKVGAPNLKPKYLRFDNYVYLLEAAAAGRGLALGWRRLIERHLNSGTLVPVTEGFVPFDRALHAKLTPRGQGQPATRRCLSFFRESAEAGPDRGGS